MRIAATTLAAALFCLPLVAAAETTAAVQRWVAHPDKSELGFTATQEGAQFSGEFHEFNASLELLPADAGIGLLQITANIKLASVDTQYRDRDDYLVQPDWFYVDMWPQAVFQSSTFHNLATKKIHQ